MYKTKALAYYDEFGGIAVILCPELLKNEIEQVGVCEVFELKEDQKPASYGLFEVEFEGHHESCDCYEPCNHDGYLVFNVVAVQKQDHRIIKRPAKSK